jgi:flagellar protein FliO/FliZ
MTLPLPRWNAIVRLGGRSGFRHMHGRSARVVLLLAIAFVVTAVAAVAADENKIIYPGSSAPQTLPVRAPSGGTSIVTVLGILALAAAGGWLVWKGRGGAPLAGRDQRLLQISETRSLGSRQYLVVASYEGKKFLLGVCPGRIDLLTPLDSPASGEKSS